MWKRLFLAIFILLSFEVGFFLIIVPWSATWENNFFFRAAVLQDVLMNPFVRGAVSGLGLLNIFLGLGEAWHFRDRISQMEAHEARNRPPVVEEQAEDKSEKA
jgi:hypothetical protein